MFSRDRKPIPKSDKPLFSDKKWVIDYRCSENGYETIKKKLECDKWHVKKMDVAKHTYQAINQDDKNLSDALKYFKDFHKEPQIMMASIYPDINDE
ncbi:MAG: hypothetical protein K8823_1394 [Cenarchaeum symbiont of Oopsacas minuta]|nr:hypothetical protein [Cenarchaeum symbiont of Oopsacas minuta]